MSGQIERNNGNAGRGCMQIAVHSLLSVGCVSRPQSRFSSFCQTDRHCLRLPPAAVLILQGDTLTFWDLAVCFSSLETVRRRGGGGKGSAFFLARLWVLVSNYSSWFQWGIRRLLVKETSRGSKSFLWKESCLITTLKRRVRVSFWELQISLSLFLLPLFLLPLFPVTETKTLDTGRCVIWVHVI